jgi:transposase
MDLFAERCAGIDIGKADLKACVRTPGPRGGRRSETRTFATTTAGVLALQGWLIDRQVTLVGTESTGVYWKPIFYPLEDHFECWLINPQHIKKVPGRKSDVSDAEWIARLVETGLVRASFVPPRQIRVLRNLTRYRTSLLRERTREVQRLHAMLELSRSGARCPDCSGPFPQTARRVKWGAGEVPVALVLFRRPLPERGVQVSVHPALQ